MKKINQYISERYPRWMDHSEYWCSVKGIPDEACDVMNEVIMDLLKKPKEKLQYLYSRKCKDLTELDFYVLRMIKLNIYSPTSPYQSRYKPLPVNSDVDFSRLRIIEEIKQLEDKPAELLDKFHQVEKAFDELDLSIKARDIFEHRFLQGLPFSQWVGNESKKELYDIYNKVVQMIKERINGQSII